MSALTHCREEANQGEVIYPRGRIAGLPEAHASRRDRFLELDELQPGWEVELRGRKGGTTVDAVFFSPSGSLHSVTHHTLQFSDRHSQLLARGSRIAGSVLHASQVVLHLIHPE